MGEAICFVFLFGMVMRDFNVLQANPLLAMIKILLRVELKVGVVGTGIENQFHEISTSGKASRSDNLRVICRYDISFFIGVII